MLAASDHVRAHAALRSLQDEHRHVRDAAFWQTCGVQKARCADPAERRIWQQLEDLEWYLHSRALERAVRDVKGALDRAVADRVERFDRRGTEPFEPFDHSTIRILSK